MQIEVNSYITLNKKNMDGWMGVQEVDNLTLRRFLRARDHNVDKAGAMLLKFLRWRAEAAPGGSVPEEQVRGELEQDKVYMGGVDRTGRPIIVGFLAKHYSANRDMAEFKSTSPCIILLCSLHCTTWPPLLLHQNACNMHCTYIQFVRAEVSLLLNECACPSPSSSSAGFVVYFFDKICAR